MLTLTDKTLDKLDLESIYKSPYVVDLNPGFGLFSRMLYERLRPKTHVLLEPDEQYHDHLNGLRKDYKNMQLVKLNGYNWPTYNALWPSPGEPGRYSPPTFGEDFEPFVPKTVPVADGLNTELLLVGNLTRIKDGSRFVSQVMQTCATGDWVQQFGRVRFLLWIFDQEKERLLPRTIQSRARPSVIADTLCRVTEVAGSGTVREGRGFQRSRFKVNEESGVVEALIEKHRAKQGRIPLTTDMRRRMYIEKLETKANLSKEKWEAPPKNVKRKKSNKRMVNHQTALAIAIRQYLALRNNLVWLDGEEGPYAGKSLSELRELYAQTEVISRITSPKEETMDDQARSFREFEEDYLFHNNADRQKKNSMDDEGYALHASPPLLQFWRPGNKSPVVVDDLVDIWPRRPIALIDFQPKLLPEFFRADDQDVKTRRFKTFDWIIRSMFTTRANTTRMALRALSPGAEYVLNELPNGTELGNKRVRVLSIEELVGLAKAWDEWVFKPEGAEWEGYAKKRPIMEE
jgi:hypothetical protein